MPTDLDAVSARRRAAKAHARTKITMLSFWVIICLGMLGLLLKGLRVVGDRANAPAARQKISAPTVIYETAAGLIPTDFFSQNFERNLSSYVRGFYD